MEPGSTLAIAALAAVGALIFGMWLGGSDRDDQTTINKYKELEAAWYAERASLYARIHELERSDSNQDRRDEWWKLGEAAPWDREP